MHEALLKSSNSIVTADDFAALEFAERTKLRGYLVCVRCGADAYFVREARNGRRACFGSRPHRPDCELASLLTEDCGSANLDETDERINAGDIFRLEPNQARAIRHVTHDPDAPAGTGSAARYTRKGASNNRTSSMSMDRLLRQLVLREEFRDSRTMLVLDDNTRGTVKTVCKHAHDVTPNDLGKRRVYWGTIQFPRPSDTGGAWLNTGSRGTLTVVLKKPNLEALLAVKGLDDVEDLSASYFAYIGPLRPGPFGGPLLFADELDWLAIRPFDQDPKHN